MEVAVGMNTDIRLSTEFWDHPKTVKLERRLGLQGPKSLQILWSWAAKYHPDGRLEGEDIEAIEIAAKWPGDEGKFVETLLALRWLDLDGETYCLHDWREFNSHLMQLLRPSPSEWNKLRKTVFQRDNFTCTYCGKSGVDIECDHIVPILRGGTNDLGNLATACIPCNRSKGAKTLEEWRQ